MIGDYLGSGEYPALGISFGIEPITEVLKMKNKCDVKKTVTELFILPIGTTKECIKIASQLRKEGVKVDMDVMGRGISKNLNYANSLGIPYVAFVGSNELKKKKIKLKDMKSGKEELISVKDVVKKIEK